jgi:uncharacterized protein
MTSSFEWNQEKAERNLQKHGVAFEEAVSIFDDLLCFVIDDPNHSIRERRFVALGYSIAQRLLIVVYTERKDKIRIISARPSTKPERRTYERNL